jgi:hypothetical protein
LAFTSGPTPSGAGTDIGFFGGGSRGDSSIAPWLSLIVGGVLLSGVGAFTLNGSRIRRWVRKA